MDEKTNQASHAPLLEILFVVTASTQSKLIGTNSSSHLDKVYIILLFQEEIFIKTY